MATKSIDLSIIIPALNEADIIEQSLSRLDTYIKKDLNYIVCEVIVVAAKDKDNTGVIAARSAKKLTHFALVEPKNRVGKGRDVSLGFKAAKGKIQVFTDADLAIPLVNIKKAFNILSAQSGDAAIFGVRTQKHSSFVRKLISFCSSLLNRALVMTRISDLQCGFKGFTAGAAALGFTDLKTQGWSFDVEVFVKLRKAKIPVIALPIMRWDSNTHHLGGENLLKASINSFIEMVKIRVRF